MNMTLVVVFISIAIALIGFLFILILNELFKKKPEPKEKKLQSKPEVAKEEIKIKETKTTQKKIPVEKPQKIINTPIEKKENKIHKRRLPGWVVLGIILLAFVLPIIPISEREPYQITINEDNCDQVSDCVCKQIGGFLWLTGEQCSCTRYKTVTRFVPLFTLLF